MKKLLVFGALCLLVVPAFGASRSTLKATMKPAARLVTMPSNQVKSNQTTNTTTETATITTVNEDVAKETKVKVNRDKERAACLKNNIGIGNTFVWASRNSNTSNYATMVEDLENPENNACFVLVGMRSEDPNIITSDIQPQYFEWGQNITCGSWVDEGKIKDRILDAKKSTRTWATVAGTLGGAGVGVGSMELFGNRLLENAGVEGVMGQDAHEKYTAEWYNAKVNELEKTNKDQYNRFLELAKEVSDACKDNNAPAECSQEKFKGVVAYCKNYKNKCK